MGEFAINVLEVGNEAARIQAIADNALSAVSNTIDRIDSCHDDVMREIASVLLGLKESVINRKKEVIKIGEGLSYAVKRFQEAEENIKRKPKPGDRTGDGEKPHQPDTYRREEEDDREELDIERIRYDWSDILSYLSRFDIEDIGTIILALRDFFVDLDLDLADWYEIITHIDWTDMSPEEIVDTLIELGYEDELLEFAAGYNIPGRLDDDALLAISVLGMYIAEPDSATIRANHTANEQLWEDNMQNLVDPNTGFIEHQSQFSDFQFGSGTMNNNGCGVIATYNALYNLTGGDVDIPFADISRAYERCGIIGGGVAGTSPAGMQMFFESQGYDTELVTGDAINGYSNPDCDTYILTAYNSPTDVTEAVHNICITYDSETNQYVMHNVGGEVTGATLQECINNYGGEAITLIAIED